MPFMFKLVRRLASGWRLGLAVAALASACAPGELKEGFAPPDQPEIVDLQVIPQWDTLETNRILNFIARGLTADGEIVTVDVEWSVEGEGTITSTGRYSSSRQGTGRVIGREKIKRVKSDTATVIINPPSVTLTAVSLTPASVALNTGGSAQFDLSGQMSDGSSAAIAASYSATGGTITADGRYTAGTTAGSYRVIAVAQGSSLADTSAVTITAAPAPTLTSLSLTPATVSLNTGATQQMAVSGQMSDGSTVTPSVTYSATGGTITGGGLYTAGGTAGSFRIIAVAQGSTVADTSAVTITAAPAPTLSRIDLTPSVVSLAPSGTQQFTAVGVLTDGSTAPVTVTFTASGGTVSATGLYTAPGTAGSYSVIARLASGTLADTSSITVTSPGSFGPPNILAKDFENGSWSPLDNASAPSSPPWSLVNNASLANGGNWSARYAVGTANTYAPGLYSLPGSYDEIYWRVDLKFTTPITGQLKFLRTTVGGGDGGGVYWQGSPRGSGSSSGLGFAFGSEGQNVQIALGLWTGQRNSGFQSQGYTTYLENWAPSGGYHRLLIHYQRNGSSTPRVRFWIDGIPVVQPNGPAYAMDGYTWGSSQGGADWVGGVPGVTPSWLVAAGRSSSGQISQLRFADQMSGNNTTTGFIYFDNFWVSSQPLQP